MLKDENNHTENPLLKELSKNPMKRIDSQDSLSLAISPSNSGTLGNLYVFHDHKSNQYFAKNVEDNPKMAFQEFIAGTLYRMMGANAPKQKMVIANDSILMTGSKEVSSDGIEFKALSSLASVNKLNDLEIKSIDQNKNVDSQSRAQKYSKLMAGAFCIGEYDINPQNYFLSYQESENINGVTHFLAGKFDHDNTFGEPLISWGIHSASPANLVHVNFIEKLAGSQYNLLEEHGNSYLYYSQSLQDRLYHQDEQFNVILNKNYFDDSKTDHILNHPGKNYLFVSFLQSVLNYTEMPSIVKDYLFDPQKICPDFYQSLSDEQSQEILHHAMTLKDIFEKRTSEIGELIKHPLQLLKKLETKLLQDGYSLPDCKLDYTSLLEKIDMSEKKNLPLYQLKDQDAAIDLFLKNKRTSTKEDFISVAFTFASQEAGHKIKTILHQLETLPESTRINLHYAPSLGEPYQISSMSLQELRSMSSQDKTFTAFVESSRVLAITSKNTVNNKNENKQPIKLIDFKE